MNVRISQFRPLQFIMRMYLFDSAVCLSKDTRKDSKVELGGNAQMMNIVGGRLLCLILSNKRFKRGTYRPTWHVSDNAHIHMYSASTADRQKISSTAGIAAVKGYSFSRHLPLLKQGSLLLYELLFTNIGWASQHHGSPIEMTLHADFPH